MLQRYNLSNQEVPLLIGRVVKYSFRFMSSQGALGVFCSYVVRRYELSTTVLEHVSSKTLCTSMIQAYCRKHTPLLEYCTDGTIYYILCIPVPVLLYYRTCTNTS